MLRKSARAAAHAGLRASAPGAARACARARVPCGAASASSPSVAAVARQARSFSSSRLQHSSWPADAKDEDEPDAAGGAAGAGPGSEPAAAPAAGGGDARPQSAYSRADPDDVQAGKGGGNAYAPTMRGMSLKKSQTAGSSFSDLGAIRERASETLRAQHDAREHAAREEAAIRARAGPSLSSEPPAPQSQGNESEQKQQQPPSESPHAHAPSGPGMSHMSSAKRSATPGIGSAASSARSAAISEAERAVSKILRAAPRTRAGETHEAVARAGVHAAMQRAQGLSHRDAVVQDVAQRAATLGVSGVGNSNFGQGMNPLPQPPRQKTLLYLQNLKKQKTPIVALTAYDYPSGLALRSADIDVCLVGDSLANVALGYSTTRHVSLDEMVFACQAVQRGLSSPLLAASAKSASPLVVADLPFGTFEAGLAQGTRSALRLVQAGKVEAVKIEGGAEVYSLVAHLSRHGIPVMGHIGLQPQKVSSTSGYRVQGRGARDAHAIWAQARALQAAGAFAVVLECVPSRLAQFITQRLDVPTIGIGAGAGTDGQVLVQSDMVGELTSPAHLLAGLAQPEDGGAVHAEAHAVPRPHANAPRPPKFVRTFAPGGTTVGALRQAAVQAYAAAVRERSFPAEGTAAPPTDPDAAPPLDEAYKMKAEEWSAFLKLVEEEEGSAPADAAKA